MNKIILRNGLIAGGILGIFVVAMVPLCRDGGLNFDYSEVVGYTSMVLAFLLVFFGIRSYRDQVGGGAITFGKAFGVGILITLIACVIYVATWEIIYFNFVPDFVDQYSAHVVQKAKRDGASDAKILETQKQLAEFKRNYANPLYNVGMTFMEVLPVGLIVTLVSAAILRRRPPTAAPAMA